jgi:hypothetical protein
LAFSKFLRRRSVSARIRSRVRSDGSMPSQRPYGLKCAR